MINLGICDNNQLDLNRLKDVTKKYLISKSYDFNISCFNSLEELHKTLEDYSFEILILDIKFENKTSFSFVKRINEIYPQTAIIFVTNYLNYFPETYLYDHVYCLEKKAIDTMLPKAIEKALNTVNNKIGKHITISANHIEHILETSQIIYLEKKLRKVDYVYRKDLNKPINDNSKVNIDVISTYAKFQEILPLLPDNFIQTHQSYVVNINYVRSVNTKAIILMNGEEILISRRYRKDVLEKIHNYFFE